LAIAQFKMTIGIINQKARDKAYFWRDFAVIPDVAPTSHEAGVLC
jgi:hypothetical protein